MIPRPPAMPSAPRKESDNGASGGGSSSGADRFPVSTRSSSSNRRVNAPKWTKWEDKQIETSIGDMRQWSNETVISYSILNSSNQPVEIVPPQIQITGRQATKKKKKKEGKGIISDQLEIRDYRLSTTRLEPGGGPTAWLSSIGRISRNRRRSYFSKSRRRTRWIVPS